MSAGGFKSFCGRRKLVLVAIVIVTASFVIAFGAQHAYFNYYQPRAHLVVAQVDPRRFEPLPQFAEFSALPDGGLEQYPKLKDLFGKVSQEVQKAILKCPTDEAVYCDLFSNSTATYDITANELQSLLKDRGINFYGTRPDGEWVAFVTRDDCYTTDILVGVQHLADDGNNESRKCYYTIRLEQIYYDSNSLQVPGYRVAIPVK